MTVLDIPLLSQYRGKLVVAEGPMLQWLQKLKGKSKLSPPPKFFHHKLVISLVHEPDSTLAMVKRIGVCKRIKHLNIENACCLFHSPR